MNPIILILIRLCRRIGYRPFLWNVKPIISKVWFLYVSSLREVSKVLT